MKTDNLTIGRKYYISIGNKQRNFKIGTLVEIVNKSSVILEDKKGNRFKCSTNRLYKTADKAVMTRKAKERARQYMNEEKRKKAESLVDKNIQNRIKKLGHSAYATMEKNKYIVRGYEQTVALNNFYELYNWVNMELAKI